MESVGQEFGGGAHSCPVMSSASVAKTQMAGAWNHMVILHRFGAWAEKAEGLSQLGAYDFSI